jgi:putative transposase
VKSRISQPDQLGLHADRGSVMRSKPAALLLADLSVPKTHSWPYTSDDNDPYSESQFRTMKYRPEFRDRFGCIQDSRALCQTFPLVQRRASTFRDRNGDTLIVHCGLATAARENRQKALDVAYASSRQHSLRSIFPRRSGSTNPKSWTPRLTKSSLACLQSR